VAIRLQNTNQFKFEESNLKNVGYLLIEQNKAPQALVVFKLNSCFFHESPNTFYDLGEAYAELKHYQQTITH
jgi:hypothetical protein